MAKRLSDKQKEKITQEFIDGRNINELVKEFGYTKLTITRYLKKNLGEKTYKTFIEKSKISKGLLINEEKPSSIDDENLLNKKVVKNKVLHKEADNSKFKQEESHYALNDFVEVAPLNYEIDEISQKDLSSIPISDIDFPKVVFMIVDNKIELKTKLLNEYPEWQFLSKEELERNTIEIFYDLKIAKRFCSKEQKVIKVPNTDVFKIVAPLLISRGISRIVTSDQLIAL